MLRSWLVTASLLTLVAISAGGPAAADAPEGEVRHAGGPTAVAGSYIVVLKDGAVAPSAVAATARRLAAGGNGRVERVYTTAIRGFEVSLSEAAARRLAANPAVDYVQQNHRVRLMGTQPSPPSWGLDRIDQRNLPLDNSYTYPRTGSNVRAYVIDTGIRFSHADFGGRAVSGYDAIDGGTADDCNGHGTHVAGTIGGATYGVAKGVTLVGVRVFDCFGNTSQAAIIAGIDWVTADHDPGEPAVANASFGGGTDSALDAAVRNSIADGVTYAIAAGNGDNDGVAINACSQSPGRVAEAITVASTNSTDRRSTYSNFGTCVDLFAPGDDILSAGIASDTASLNSSGTSMSAPHVTGTAALVLSANPSITPAQVRDHLFNTATVGVVVNAGNGSPNRLLYSDSGAVRIASYSCDTMRAKVNCSVGYVGGIAPIAIRWSLAGNDVGSWNDLTSISIGCVPGNIVNVGVRLIDATGVTASTAGRYTCPSGNP